MGLLDEKIIKNQNFITNGADKVFNWARLSSLWMLFYGIACCGIEGLAATSPRYDIERFGIGPGPTPRHSDLMIIMGPVVKKMVPVIKTLYAQMPEPKFVISMGSCANTGGAFADSYNVIRGAHKVIPVDVFIPGCHPRAETLLYGLVKLQEHIRTQSFVHKKPTKLKEPIYVPETLTIEQEKEIEKFKKKDETEKIK